MYSCLGARFSRATRISRSQTEEKIVKALWELRSLRPSSQRGYAQKIKFLNKQTDLDNSLETEKYVLSLNNANKYKSTLLSAFQQA
jgi:hypothetical protein